MAEPSIQENGKANHSISFRLSRLWVKKSAIRFRMKTTKEAQYHVLRQRGHSPSEAFNETVEELTQSLMPLVAENGMDWMFANCSTTAQRGALDWKDKFRDATTPVFNELYDDVFSGKEAAIVIEANSKPDYREKLNAELKQLQQSELWQTGMQVRKLRPQTK